MSAREVLVVGFGKRVREAALPSLALCEGLSLRGIVARGAREVDGHSVGALSELRDLSGVDVVYLAVGKDAVPEVLARLVDLGVGDKELLIDTPVVRFRHFRHVAKLKAFARVSVPEDCAFLPWFDAVRAAVGEGVIGEPHTVVFQRSAYAYHGLATARALLGATSVRSGRRRRVSPEELQRDIVFRGGKRARVVEPRDYSIGRVSLSSTRGSISDHAQDAQDDHLLEVVVEGDEVAGFRIGHVETRLDEAERALTIGDDPAASVIARQEAMKRVGFLRIWRRIARGEEGYPLADGIDDMVVDYHLEKVGRYVANPFTSSRTGVGRTVLGTLSRLGD